LNVGVQKQVLAKILSADFGINVDEPFGFEPLCLVSGSAANRIRLLVESMWSTLHEGEPRVPRDSPVGYAAERLLLLQLMHAAPHNYSDAVAKDRGRAKPYYVRRVERYVNLHFAEKVSLNDLVESSGVSERTLQTAFREFHGASPMGYLKSTRLLVAREMLLVARQNDSSLRDICDAIGYVSPSHFSRDYKSKFGVAPRVTRDNPGQGQGR
jgi:AraC-like DNA-binding protein